MHPRVPQVIDAYERKVDDLQRAGAEMRKLQSRVDILAAERPLIDLDDVHHKRESETQTALVTQSEIYFTCFDELNAIHDELDNLRK